MLSLGRRFGVHRGEVHTPGAARPEPSPSTDSGAAMNHTPTTPRLLSDDALMRAIREHLAEATRRPGLAATIRQLLAGELEDMKAAMLASSSCTPEEIVAACHVSPDPEPHGAKLRICG